MLLGELVEELRKWDKSIKVKMGFNDPHGDEEYGNLAFTPAFDVTIGEMLESAEKGLFRYMPRIRGQISDSFYVSKKTPVFLGYEGQEGEVLSRRLLRYMLLDVCDKDQAKDTQNELSEEKVLHKQNGKDSVDTLVDYLRSKYSPSNNGYYIHGKKIGNISSISKVGDNDISIGVIVPIEEVKINTTLTKEEQKAVDEVGRVSRALNEAEKNIRKEEVKPIQVQCNRYSCKHNKLYRCGIRADLVLEYKVRSTYDKFRCLSYE